MRRDGRSGGAVDYKGSAKVLASSILRLPREASSHSTLKQEHSCVIKRVSSAKSTSLWANDGSQMAADRPISECFPQIRAVFRGLA